MGLPSLPPVPKRQKQSMKRRRPWASTSTIVATTILLTAQAWTGVASDLPVFLQDEPMFFEGDLPQELDVESPSVSPTISPVPTLVPQPSLASEGALPSVVKQNLDLSYDLVLNVTKITDMTDLLGDIKTVMEDYLFRELRLLEAENDFQIRRVTLAVSLLVRRMLLRYRHLQDQGTQDITIEVDGSVQYDLGGGGDITPEGAELLLEEKLETLLTEDSLRLELQTKGVEGVVDVDEATIVDQREENIESSGGTNMQTGGGDVSGTTDNTERTFKGLFGGTKEGDLERPSTLSIVFGFALTGIAFLGLVAYGYIFYRKRQKRLRRKKQMKNSIQYRLPAPKVSPAKRSAPNTPQRQQQPQQLQQQQPVPTMKMAPVNPDDDDSSASSYKGLDSVSEDGPADSFARELQMAASLDEQAWEDFQRKKEALNKNEVIRATEVGSAFGQYDSGTATTPRASPPTTSEGGGKAWAKSFPYGDEQEVMEEGIEWTADGGADDWNSYDDTSPRATTASANKAEEKKDEWGNDEEKEPPASASTAAILESIQRDLAMHGTSIDPEPAREDMTASDVVLEVERLSRYVKRYEKRKERRSKRESERSFRSSDASSSAYNLSIPSPTHSSEAATPRSIRETSVSPQGITPRSREPMSRSLLDDSASPKAYTPRSQDFSAAESYRGGYSVSQKENFQRQEQAPRISPYTGTFDNTRSALSPHNPDLASISDFPDEVSEDTFDYTFQEQEHEGSLRSQRLGITPFNAQKEEEPSFNYEAMSPMMQKLAKAEALRSSREDHSLPTDEPIMERRRRTQSEGGAYANRGSGQLSSNRGNHAPLEARRPGRLSDLRDNNAIIDSSQSDVNVGFFPPPHDEGVEIPLPRGTSEGPRTPSARPTQKKPSSAPSPNSRKFNKLRNLFEERQNEAIFPPDQHWQYGIAK